MTDEDEFQDQKSKSQLKREMNALQDLGELLIKFPATKLKKIPLPDDVRAAIEEAQRIKAHGALRRQRQYIGRLMREIDAEPIRQAVEALLEHGNLSAQKFHRLERWRDRLIDEGETAFGEFLSEYPAADRQQLRQLIRNAQKEKSAEKPPKAYRDLFRLLRELSEQQVDE